MDLRSCAYGLRSAREGHLRISLAKGKPVPSVPLCATKVGDTIVVPSPGSNKALRIIGYRMSAAAPVNVKLKSASIDFTGPEPAQLGINAGPDLHEGFWLGLAANEALMINLDAAVPVGGIIYYIVIG